MPSPVLRGAPELTEWPLKGFDLSSHNKAAINWTLMARDFNFAYARVSVGAEEDTTGAANIRFYRKMGLIAGAYGWFDQRRSIAAQIQVFHEQLRAVELGPGDLYPIVDVEPPPAKPGEKPIQLNVEWWRGILRGILPELFRRYRGVLIYGNLADLTKLALTRGPWDECEIILARFTTLNDPGIVPGLKPPVIWQLRGDKFPTVPPGLAEGYGDGDYWIDLNVAKYLPTIDPVTNPEADQPTPPAVTPVLETGEQLLRRVADEMSVSLELLRNGIDAIQAARAELSAVATASAERAERAAERAELAAERAEKAAAGGRRK